MIPRFLYDELKNAVEKFPVVCINGPRQCGKTTLTKIYCSESKKEFVYLDLEKLEDFRRISDPGLFFRDHREKLIIIDEVQRLPELFPQIRAEVDDDRRSGRFLILGSASPDIVMNSSESLAGRIKYIHLHPFILPELKNSINLKDLLFWGGFPNVVLDNDIAFRKDWLDNFIYTYLERDLPMLGLKTSPVQVRRLWEMLAYQAGNLLNSSSIGRSLGVSNHTVNAYIDYLEGAFMIYRIDPFMTNIKKRLVKSKKIYIADTGLLHRLLRIESYDQLMSSPFAGHSWENFVLTQILPIIRKNWNISFYRTHSGVEADLILGKGIKAEICIEIKLSSAPSLTHSFTTAIEDLKTMKNYIIIPEGKSYRIREDITVCDINEFCEISSRL
ncbi:ATP-binding protein [candidate division KSB1 bacterium]